jgi:hypothetical protein
MAAHSLLATVYHWLSYLVMYDLWPQVTLEQSALASNRLSRWTKELSEWFCLPRLCRSVRRNTYSCPLHNFTVVQSARLGPYIMLDFLWLFCYIVSKQNAYTIKLSGVFNLLHNTVTTSRQEEHVSHCETENVSSFHFSSAVTRIYQVHIRMV